MDTHVVRFSTLHVSIHNKIYY